MRPRLVLALAVTVLALAGCDQLGGTPSPGGTTGGAPVGTTPAATPTGTGTAGTATQPPPAPEPTETVTDFKITYNWAIPAGTVAIKNAVKIPIGGPNDPPLPYLVGIYVGDHPEGTPAYQRMSFYFRGGFPSYNIGYVASVVSEGEGKAIPLQGNAFLRVGFTDAQMHTNTGSSTLKAAPRNPINFDTLRSYGFAGDFEGHVTYGLGLQVAPASDQVLKIRTGQLKKSNYFVVFVDIEAA